MSRFSLLSLSATLAAALFTLLFAHHDPGFARDPVPLPVPSPGPLPPPPNLVKMDSKIHGLLHHLLPDESGLGFADELDEAELAELVFEDAREAAGSDDWVRLIWVNDDIHVHVYVHLDGVHKEALYALRNHGFRLELVNEEHDIVQGWLPIDRLSDLAELDEVRRITPPSYATPRVGSVTSEGDDLTYAHSLRNFSGMTGQSVKVGVIADGAAHWKDAQDSNDLPQIITFDPNHSGSGDEGTALMEIIHDLAPDAQLVFAGVSTNLEMISAIDWMMNDSGAGIAVIVDDLGYYGEPFFEDGPTAKKVQEAVDAGVIYVSAAGNDAQAHYTGQLSILSNRFHEFYQDPNDPNVFHTHLTFRSDGGRVFLQWNEPWGAASTDLDLWVCNIGSEPSQHTIENGLCRYSYNDQDGDDNPVEIISGRLLSAGRTYSLYVTRRGSAPKAEPMIKVIVEDGEILPYSNTSINPRVRLGSIVGHPALPGVVAVGAVEPVKYPDPFIESASSLGPVEIYHPKRETRPKPDLVAPDCVRVTGAGGFASPFCGTSAAAPHVAAIAALLVQYERLKTSTQIDHLSKAAIAKRVVKQLKDGASDLGTRGRDNVYGYGLVNGLCAHYGSEDQLCLRQD